MLDRLRLIRGIGCLLVVYYHSIELLNANTSLNLIQFHVIEAGLDLFFILSGFIIAYVTKPSEQPSRFLSQRFARVVPMYWFVTVAAVALIMIRPWYFNGADLNWSTFLGSMFFIPMPDAEGVMQPILFVGWTVNWEWLFYAFFAVSMLLPSRFRIWGMCAMLLVAYTIGSIAQAGTSLSFYGNTIAFDFIIGAMLGVAARDKAFMARWSVATARMLIAVSLVATVIVGVLFEQHVSPHQRALIWGLPMVGLVFGCAVLDLKLPRLKGQMLPFVGDISYSIYLLHPFMLTVPAIFMLNTFGTGWVGAIAVLATVFFLTVGGAILSYKLIERPGQKFTRNLFKKWAERLQGESGPAKSWPTGKVVATRSIGK